MITGLTEFLGMVLFSWIVQTGIFVRSDVTAVSVVHRCGGQGSRDVLSWVLDFSQCEQLNSHS